MTNSARWWLAGGSVAAVLIVAGVGFLIWQYGQAAYWSTVSQWPLDESEVSAVEACEDPGWLGLLKVLEQDLDVDCSDTWFATQARPHLDKRHRQRARWLRKVVEDAARSRRAVFRAGSALLVSEREAPPDLAVTARILGVDPEVLVDAITAGDWPEGPWLDPTLAGHLAARRLSLDAPATVDAVVASLRAHAVGAAPPSTGTVLGAAAFEALELDPELLDAIVARRAQNLSLGAYPASLVRETLGDGRACVGDGRGGAACSRWLADRLEAAAEEGDARAEARSVSAAADELDVVWTLRDAEQAWRAPLLTGHVGVLGAWIAEEEEPERRAARLEAVVLSGGRFPEGLASGELVLEDVLTEHTGGAWTRAAMARALGAEASVPVQVGAVDEDVWLLIGERAWRLGACGRVVPVRADEKGADVEPWSGRAVLAQLAVEESTAALLRQEVTTSRRLGRLAARLDPVSAGAFPDVLEQATGGVEDPVAVAAVSLGRAPAPEEDTAARLARDAVGARLAATWSPQRCTGGS